MEHHTPTNKLPANSIEVVQTFERSEEVAQLILEASKSSEIVVGADCEGILRGRPLCLIQIYFDGCTYIFDLLEFNPFRGQLREVLESTTIIKVFHDFCEDAASLINHYGVKAERVFDTQIAHRVLANCLNPTKLTENNSISLNRLLKAHLELSNELKDYMSDKLKSNITLWEKRPLTDEMINYSAQDVWYLPRAYRVFWEKATKFQSSLDCDLIGEVFKESRKCNIYAYINMNCKNLMCCKAGQYLTAFLKNFQKFCIYWSLNLGCTGVVLDQKSIKFIKTYFQMGDMLNLEISRIDLEDKKMVLKVPEYYLNMDSETIANYCFYAKSQHEKKLTRDYLNIYYNKDKPQIKTNLKLTAKNFFGSSAQNGRDRTYSGNESISMPTLETMSKSLLKSSESTDKLIAVVEEQKVSTTPTPIAKKPDVKNEIVESNSEPSRKKSEIKTSVAKQATKKESAFACKKEAIKQKKTKRKAKKTKDFTNWFFVSK